MTGMIFDEEDYSSLRKMGIKTYLDLCLKVPKQYNDTTPIEEVGPNQVGALNVEINSYSPSSNSKILSIKSTETSTRKTLFLRIFHPKPYTKKLFPIHEKVWIWGHLIQVGDVLCINQPKCIKNINTITLEFKDRIANNLLNPLIKKYITRTHLRAYLPNPIVKAVLQIFFPSREFAKNFNKSKTFPQECVEALKFIEIYSYIKELRKKRIYFQTRPIQPQDYKCFISSLPFTLTPSQTKVIQDISKDLSSGLASRRMIIGDVGCGKTIIILASVFMNYPRKSVLMIPTTILAQQIYEEAQKYLPKYIFTQLILSSSKKSSQEGVFFLIGTHALLHRQFNTEEFNLIMIDEQHRFGTQQRHHLQKIIQNQNITDSQKFHPHFLQFSATPIPRTLRLIESNLIDFSLITDLPFKKDIFTQIIHKSDIKKLLAHIQNEINKGNQTIIVYPLVEQSKRIKYLSIQEGISFWIKHFEGVYTTHGQDKNKNEILREFAKKGSILLTTTLIEVGLSLSKLSTVVIVAPELLGLATLHQIRGRVSRNGLKGYCFLYTHKTDSKRLEMFAKISDGFKIAELDLKQRNSGDLLDGTKQSGSFFNFFDPGEDEEILKQAQRYMELLEGGQTKRENTPLELKNVSMGIS